METAGILGLGLIGGSLAKALKTKCNFKKIVAYNRSLPPLIKAYDENVIDIYTTQIDDSFKDCNIIFICTTVDTVCSYAEKLIPFINNNCILTDVGSAKRNIVEKMQSFENINFVGGHPMAGSEKTGYEASKHYLFENAYYILTPTEKNKKEHIEYLENLVKLFGAIPIIMNPQEHDFTVSAISHTPHVIAAALVNSVQKLNSEVSNGKMSMLAAGGFKDITRIASSSPSLWNTICFDNKDEIINMLHLFKNQIDTFENELSINNGNVSPLFENAKNYRDSINQTTSNSYIKNYEIKVDVEDKPGIIATVATMLSVNNINIKNIGIINSRAYENGVLQIVFDSHELKEKSISLLKEMNFNVFTD